MKKLLGVLAFVSIFALPAGPASARSCQIGLNGETVCSVTSDASGFRPARHPASAPVFVPHTKAEAAVLAHKQQTSGPVFVPHTKAEAAVLAHKQLTSGPVFVPHTKAQAAVLAHQQQTRGPVFVAQSHGRRWH
jgi:hypothetical protein